MDRPVALAFGQEITQPNVAKGAAHQDLVVAAPRSVAVELGALDAMLDQVVSRRAVGRDAAGRGDVVRRDRVTDDDQRPSALDVGQRRWGRGHVLEERRFLDIGGGWVPLVNRARRRRQSLPVLVAVEDPLVFPREHLDLERAPDRLVDLIGRGPEFVEEDIVAGFVLSERFFREVPPNVAGEGVRHHQRRRGQVTRLDQRMDPTLEVPVAAQHRDHIEFFLLDGGLDLVTRERTAVADAGGAAIADEVEAELLQVSHEAGRLEVVGHDSGAGREAGLDGGRDLQSALDGSLGQQAGGHHHRGIRGVGATGDGGDHDRAVADLRRRSGHHRRRVLLLPEDIGGPAFGVEAGDIVVGGLRIHGEGRLEALPHAGQRDAVLRALGPGDAGLDRVEVQIEQLAEDGRRGVVGTEHSLCARVLLHQLDQLRVTSRRLQVAERLRVDREEGGGGTVFRAHVREGGSIRHRQARQAGAAKLDELVDHAVPAQHLGERQDQVGGGRTGPHRAGHPHAHHDGGREVGRLAEQRGLGLDAAHPPAEHAQPIDHGRVRVGAEQRIRQRIAPFRIGADLHDPAQSFEVDLVTDAHPGRHHGEVVERLLRPA